MLPTLIDLDSPDPDLLVVTTFNSGEPHVRFRTDTGISKKSLDNNAFIIACKLVDSHQLMKLLTAVSALRSIHADAAIYLYLGYFPGGRQDRREHLGEPFTAEVYGDLINSIGAKGVWILDPHSDVTGACVKRANFSPADDLVRYALNSRYSPWKAAPGVEQPLIVIPDAGAIKRTLKLIKNLGGFPTAQAIKVRDTITGHLNGTRVLDEVEGRECIIIDDICSRGGTFRLLSEKLRQHNAKSVDLIVSHMEHCADIPALTQGIRRITTTNSLMTPEVEQKFRQDYSDVLDIVDIRNLWNPSQIWNICHE